MNIKKIGLLLILPVVALVGYVSLQSGARASFESTYGDIALANFEDSLQTAKDLKKSLVTLTETPNEENLKNAKKVYETAREVYQQTEVFRFGNSVVDDFEGKVNAWPLDEGLIDYVDRSYGKKSGENPFYTANIIRNKKIRIAGLKINASVINKELLKKFHEIEEVESNVATGYHAIEFLLWGQDLNGNKPGAGTRVVTDYAKGSACTNGNCNRRADYLLAAADLLIEDLQGIVTDWKKGGQARKELDKKGISSIITGMGSLAYGELAGERTKLGLMLGDPEEEHDCFSDLTHVSHYYDVVGINNLYYGMYTRVNGDVVSGLSLRDIIMRKDKTLARELDSRMRNALEQAKTLYTYAVDTESYDVMIAKGNEKGNRVVQDFVDGLVAFSKSLEKSVNVLGLKTIEFEGSDSLDSPSKVG